MIKLWFEPFAEVCVHTHECAQLTYTGTLMVLHKNVSQIIQDDYIQFKDTQHEWSCRA